MKIQEYLKAIGPALTALAMTLVTAVNVGHFDLVAVETGAVGLASALVSLCVTNGPTGIRSYMKSLAPAVLTLIGVGIHALVTGGLGDPAELRIAVSGLLTSVVALILPNIPPNPVPPNVSGGLTEMHPSVARALDLQCASVVRGAYYFIVTDEWVLSVRPDDAGRFRVGACYGSTEVATLWSSADDQDRLLALAQQFKAEIQALRR